MDECDDVVDDALFYPSDFEDDIGLDGGLEEEDWDPLNAIEGGCFFLDDFESLSDLEEDEGINSNGVGGHGHHDEGEDDCDVMNGGTSIFSFDHVLVERSSSIQFPQFTFASRNLMIHSLSHDYIPSCQEILTADPLSKGLLNIMEENWIHMLVIAYVRDGQTSKRDMYVHPLKMERVCFTRKITHHAKFHGLKSGVQ